MGEFVKHTACPSCGSSDGLAIYSDNSSHCFVCQKTVPSEEFKDEKKKPKRKGLTEKKRKDEMTEKVKASVTPEETESLKGKTGLTAGGYRGIRDDVLKVFGVRTELDESDEVLARYYPCTTEGELTGWKRRGHPKNFGGSIGNTGNSCDLFGQFRFKNGGKVCLIVGGEEDQLAAYQMLKDYYVSKGWDFEPVVVSPTVGETGCAKQIANQYSWFDGYSKIVIGMDTDDAGKAAIEKIITVLPKGKTFIANWSLKDPNEMLLKGKEKQFISDFYNAKAYVPVGVVGSNQISDAMREEFKVPKIPLPPFMHKLQDMMAGGVPLGRIVNLGSASGTGKSTIIDEIIYYMIFNSPHLVGVVTLESTKGQYGNKLLSRHIGKKLELMTNEEALALLNEPWVKEKEYELFNTPDGKPRMYLVDDRDGDVSDIQTAIENLIVSCGCKVIVCDPVHDIISSLPLDEQINFVNWQKGMVKSHFCTFYNVAHTRKSGSGQKAGSVGADLHEEDMMGTGDLYKSAACNLMFSRNKEAEDDIERNTITMKATKLRWTGRTGIAGKYYYDNESHTMWDLDDWLNRN